MQTRHHPIPSPKLLLIALATLGLAAGAGSPSAAAVAPAFVRADSAAADTTRSPQPAPAPAPAPAAPLPPAPTPAPAPAPSDTTKRTMSAPAASDTSAASEHPSGGAATPAITPPPAPAPAPPPVPLTPKQRHAAEKAAQAAARAAQHPANPEVLAAWQKGKRWLSLRVGGARSGEKGAANGNFGAGAGVTYFVRDRLSIGLFGHGDLLGKFGGAAEIEYPVTLEVDYHLRWKTALRPYFGLGSGIFYHKYFRTGADEAKWRGGSFLAGGMNAPISQGAVLGVDARMELVGGDPKLTNPVFGGEREQLKHYSFKLGYSIAF